MSTVMGISSAQAGACEDAWFTRNSIMNDAGYCFGTPLGQSIFDNSDCTGKSVELSAQDQNRVAQLKEVEAYQDCAIDTDLSFLLMNDYYIRVQLETQPVLYEDGEGFYCIGYYGQTDLLRASPHTDSPVIGGLRAGDWFITAHREIGPWSYITVREEDVPDAITGGWIRLPEDFYVDCERAAG